MSAFAKLNAEILWSEALSTTKINLYLKGLYITSRARWGFAATEDCA